YLLALLIGVVAGMRTMTAPAVVSWAARLGWLHLDSTWLAFLGYSWTPWILTLAAIGELVTDQLPSTPSRKVPMQFGARIVTGALSGAALGVAGGSLIAGAIAGAIGAARWTCRQGTAGGSFRQGPAGRVHRRRNCDRGCVADRTNGTVSYANPAPHN